MISFFFWAVYPVTRTSFNTASVSTKPTLIKLLPSKEASWVSKPITEIMIFELLLGNLIENLPVSSVEVPIVVPLTITEAATKGFPVALFITIPSTVFWANRPRPVKSSSVNNNKPLAGKLFLFGISMLV